ncbi:ATP-binding protein [Streptomyces sp. H34-S4]|uniref:ATP-binding protein n=1 Tax=Streptomyces sp. H34-S4 TaxID=2996463 RepID=UPI00226DE6E7|nr:ATP-binding protein [Streptomyces sp. H34-S4]MCY0937592.1 ATP-binding protein [Streptomyces sp. H34-S4]
MDTMGTDLAAGPVTASPASARERTRAFLDTLARPLAEEAEQSVVLVVSELVTNALRHGGGTYTLDLTAHPDGIEVAVHDPSPHPPVMRTPDLSGTGGFGWPMVNRLALATHITAAPGGGKTVRALLPR